MSGQKRARNPRVLMVQDMREIMTYLRVSLRRWSQPPSLRRYDAGDGRGVQWQQASRNRKDVPAGEYQENQPVELERLIRFMDVIEELTGRIKATARRRIAELERAERNGG